MVEFTASHTKLAASEQTSAIEKKGEAVVGTTPSALEKVVVEKRGERKKEIGDEFFYLQMGLKRSQQT